ncbi:MAG: hypothetical protein JXM74_02800 [Fusobacteriaceae bacterium]|nr:hypothetical protein [Fusobacteriaceae bacterium]MBN2837660.1 hypothetical protein [Fusobacteriaceae bacterium]
MKKIIFIILIALTIFTSCTNQKKTGVAAFETKDKHFTFLSSKSPYPYEVTDYSSPPKNYNLVFINYVGRHGSRHLSSSKYDKTLFELLSIAEKDGEITNLGKELKDEISKLMKVEEGNYGLLTIKGKKELENIGRRTAINNKKLFSYKSEVIAYATYSDRAKESRDEFLKGLKKEINSVSITSNFYEEFKDPYLRPYDIAERYIDFEENGEWNSIFNEYTKREIGKKFDKEILLKLVSERFYDRLEKGEFKLKDENGKVKLKNPTEAVSNLYNLYIISAALKEEGLFEFKKYFTNEQLAWYESIISIEDYLQKGPSITSLPTDIIAPLVKNMINSTENGLKNPNLAGIFNFAHAETIIPLVSFLEISTYNESSNNPTEILKNWDASTVTPMAANIQWLIYSNGKDLLVKMLQNEKEVAFPIKTNFYPYYKWEDVKKYYQDKIEKIGFSNDNNLENDIKNLKENF